MEGQQRNQGIAQKVSKQKLCGTQPDIETPELNDIANKEMICSGGERKGK